MSKLPLLRRRGMSRRSIASVLLHHLHTVGKVGFDVFFPRQYSYTAIWHPLLGLDRPPKVTRHTVSSNLSRLQRQGLVARSRTGEWILTPKGEKYLSHQKRHITLPSTPVSDGALRLVIFDIPEKQKEKRAMIRAALIDCAFEQLQKSVWIGEHPLPRDFVTLIDDLGIAKHVHIFSVSKEGTLFL